jgi:hypothetical protein
MFALLGLGDAQRATVSSNDAIYVNPAGMALANVYSLEIGLLDDLSGTDRRYNASVVDSQAGPVAGGVAYTYTDRIGFDPLDGQNHSITGHRIDIALASKVGDHAALGVGGHYLTFGEKVGPTQTAGASFNAFTVDAGFQVRTESGFGLGLAAYNLTNSDRPEIPVGWGGGLAYQLDAFSIEGDVRWNAKIGRATVSGSMSYILARALALRVGGQYDLSNDSSALSLGVGYAADQYGIDVGYRQRIAGPGTNVIFGPTGTFVESERILGVAIRYVFSM